MQTCVNFTSSLFKPFLSVDAQVNPQCYGAELAWWLAQELAKKGIETSYPNFEDWGWFVEYIVGDSEYRLCCSNVDGASDQWQISLRRHAKGLFGRRKAEPEVAAPLVKALSEILLETPDIKGIEWSEDGET